ncbi:MAG: hypothetical protein LBK60_03740 [Verrucomicrobiales bacterium]|nr:hypothetical protein [Verrucomicrobiales bacterium]
MQLDTAAMLLWHSLQSLTVSDPQLLAWQDAECRPVPAAPDRHAIHSYFNLCPESPDGGSVLYFTSAAVDGERGELRVLNRVDGVERIIVSGLVAEDAHRVACQQWLAGGEQIAYHNYDPRDRRWRVFTVSAAGGAPRLLAEDRQLGMGAAAGDWAPLYGCHWNPGVHRDLELVNVRTGAIHVAVTISAVLEQYGADVEQLLGGRDVSIFFPVLSPDGQRVFFKLARGGGGNDFRSPSASKREGMVIYDFAEKRFLGFHTWWGHPSWTRDGKKILTKVDHGSVLFDAGDGAATPLVPGAASNHPSFNPAQTLYVTDANIAWKNGGRPGEWGIFAVAPSANEFTLIHRFPFRTKGLGAQSWRLPDPHPVFSADGQRIYFNANAGPWTRLQVIELVKKP